MPLHLCLAHYGPGLMGYQSGACIVRQVQEQTGPEYIRPGTASSKSAVTPADSKSTYDVRWGKPGIGIDACFYKGLPLIQGGTARCPIALAEQQTLTTESYDQRQCSPMPTDPDTSPLDQIMTLTREIVDDCPACAGKASQIAMWAREIRERRPSRQELEALVDATCKGFGPDGQRKLLIEGLRALVRFAE